MKKKPSDPLKGERRRIIEQIREEERLKLLTEMREWAEEQEADQRGRIRSHMDTNIRALLLKEKNAETLMRNQFIVGAHSVGFTDGQIEFLWDWIEAISKKDL